VLQLFQALARSQVETDRFFGVDAGTVPAAEFYAADNIGRILGVAAADRPR
jgi:hypothetical protein